ncbi:MAG TPA: galactosyltransferase-related protein, partial [Cyclobacteriaceae bacterium]|nr:galactosyltransferase-related protein [Cyclobacteriaceae bacterium]
VLLSDETTRRVIKDKRLSVAFFEPGIRNRFNSFFSPLLSKIVSRTTNRLEGTRTCNMAFWKSDFIKINGFNEDIVGWGREDTEMAVRLMNTGVKRYNLKLVGFGYHLFHPENSREMLSVNDGILSKTISERLMRCVNGVNKYMALREA